MTPKRFVGPEAASDMAATSKQTLQAPSRFETPWQTNSATCSFLIRQEGMEEDVFRLVDMARFAAVILSACREYGPRYRGGSRPLGPKRAFKVQVYGNMPPP